MSDIVYIADPEILAIPVQECGEPMIDCKDYDDLLIGPTPECDATQHDYTKMRQTVYEKLLRAQNDLPKGWRFRLYEAFRSVAVQQFLFDLEMQRAAEYHPKLNKEQLFHEVTRLVSPVHNYDGSTNIPPHNTGAAVDIEIVDEEHQLVDMGMTAKDWMKVDAEYCLTHCHKISAQAQQNRRILLETLEAHEFVNYATEWWHFSYGDRYWAYHKQQPHAFYGPVG